MRTKTDYEILIEKSVPLTPKEFMLFELEFMGRWVNKARYISGGLSHLFKNRYQREKAIEELFQDDLIAIAYPPLGKYSCSMIKFEPVELNSDENLSANY